MLAVIYLALLLFFAVSSAVVQKPPSSIQIYLLIFALMTHAPAFLKISDIRRLAKLPASKMTYPDAILPGLLLVFWSFPVFTGSIDFYRSMTVFIFVLALSLGVTAVRGIHWLQKHYGKQSPFMDISLVDKVGKVGQSNLYYLRIAATAMSLLYAWTWVLTGINAVSPWLLIGCILLVALISISLATYQSMTRAADMLKSEVKQNVDEVLGDRNVQAAIYFSGRSIKNTSNAKNLLTTFLRENVPSAMILRESGSQAQFKKFKHNIMLTAPTIATLDTVASHRIKNVFYPSHVAKNGHFIRFGEYKHILLAQNAFDKLPNLPSGTRMYDVVIAPSQAKMLEWTEMRTSDCDPKIVSIGTLSKKGNLCLEEPTIIVACIDPENAATFSGSVLLRLNELGHECSQFQNLKLSVVILSGSPRAEAIRHKVMLSLGPQLPDSVEVIVETRSFCSDIGDIHAIIAEDQQIGTASRDAVYLCLSEKAEHRFRYVKESLAGTIEALRHLDGAAELTEETYFPDIASFLKFIQNGSRL